MSLPCSVKCYKAPFMFAGFWYRHGTSMVGRQGTDCIVLGCVYMCVNRLGKSKRSQVCVNDASLTAMSSGGNPWPDKLLKHFKGVFFNQNSLVMFCGLKILTLSEWQEFMLPLCNGHWTLLPDSMKGLHSPLPLLDPRKLKTSSLERPLPENPYRGLCSGDNFRDITVAKLSNT